MFEEIKENAKKRMEGAIAALHTELQGLRTGRASAELLNPAIVEIYGGKFKINQLASISVPEPKMLIIQVWEQGNVDKIIKAITNANLGLSPAAEGATIRIIIPDMSEERRKEMAQIAYKCAEQTKISIRNVRRDAVTKLKQIKKDIPEDEHHHHLDAIQKLTDNMIKTVDQMSAKKQEDILNI
ncbi:ribosome-recycling factor [Rickettsiales bacterium]|nr:ribosome-recycling factor [Rickettsiales bacterium]